MEGMTAITPQEAEFLILESASVLVTDTVAAGDALGRILREDLFADRPFPPFDRMNDGASHF